MPKNAANLGIEFSTQSADDTDEQVQGIRESLMGIQNTLKSIKNINAFQAILDGFSLSKLGDIKDTVENTFTSLKDNVQMSSSLDSEFASARKSAKELANSMGLNNEQMAEMRDKSSFAPALNMDMQEVQKTYATLLNRQQDINDLGFDSFKQFSKFIEVNDINGQEYVQTLDKLNKTFGLSKEQISGLQDNVATISQEFGVGGAIMNNFGEITSTVGEKLKAVNGEATPEKIKSYTEQVAEMTGLFKETGQGTEEAKKSAMAFTTSILESRKQMKEMVTGQSGEVPQLFQNIATSQMGFNNAQKAMGERPVEFVQRLGEQYGELSKSQKQMVNQRVFSELDSGVREFVTSGNMEAASNKLDNVRDKMKENEGAASAMAKSYDTGRTAAERLSFIEDNFEKQLLDVSRSMGIQESMINRTRQTYGLITDNLKTFTNLQSTSKEAAKENNVAIQKWGVTLRSSSGELTKMGHAVRTVSRLFVAFQTGGLYGVGHELTNLLEKYTEFTGVTDVVKSTVKDLSGVFNTLMEDGLLGVYTQIENLGPLKAFDDTLYGIILSIENLYDATTTLLPNVINLVKALWEDGLKGLRKEMDKTGVLMAYETFYINLKTTLRSFKNEALDFLSTIPSKFAELQKQISKVGESYPMLENVLNAAQVLVGMLAGGRLISAASKGMSVISGFFSRLGSISKSIGLSGVLDDLSQSFIKSMNTIWKTLTGRGANILDMMGELFGDEKALKIDQWFKGVGDDIAKFFANIGDNIAKYSKMLLSKASDEMARLFSRLGGRLPSILSSAGGSFMKAIGGFFSRIGARFISIAGGVFSMGGIVGKGLTMLFTPPLGWITAILSGIGMIRRLVEDHFKGGFSGLGNTIVSYTSKIFGSIIPDINMTFSGFAKSVGSFLLDSLGSMVLDLIAGLQTVFDLGGMLMGWIASTLSGINFRNLGKTLVSSIRSGAKFLITSLIGGIASLFDQTKKEGKSTFLERIGSMFKSLGNLLYNTAWVLGEIVLGLGNFLIGIFIETFRPVIDTFLPWAVDNFGDMFHSIGDWLYSFDWSAMMSKAWGELKGAIVSAFSGIVSLGSTIGKYLTKMWNSAKSYLSMGWEWFKEAGLSALESTINFGIDIVEGFVNTFLDVFDSIRVKALTVWEHIKFGLQAAMVPIKLTFFGLVDVLKYKVFGPIVQTLQDTLGSIISAAPNWVMSTAGLDPKKWRDFAQGGMVESALGKTAAENLRQGVSFSDIKEQKVEKAKSKVGQLEMQKDLNIDRVEQGKAPKVALGDADFTGEKAEDKSSKELQKQTAKSSSESEKANKEIAKNTRKFTKHMSNIDKRQKKKQVQDKTGTDNTTDPTGLS